MPEWLLERGIGETRAALVENGEIIEARIEPDDVKPAGSIVAARLISTGVNGRNAVARDDGGVEYLLPRGAGAKTQGSRLHIEVTRARIPGSEPWKRPLGRIADSDPVELPPLSQRLHARHLSFPAPTDALEAAGWSGLIDEARTGVSSFEGGQLRIAVTPAMTLIDVDGHLAPEELALRGAAAAARAIRRLDIGGSIGIDLPTTSGRASRQASAAALDEALPQPFERTAVNGFGFVQVVRPRLRASLLELGQDRAVFETRALLRRAALEPPGAKLLVVHPAVGSVLHANADWLDELGRQIGGAVALRCDPAIAICGAYAQRA